MLDAKFVLENKEFVVKRIASRGVSIDLDDFVRLSEGKKAILQKSEVLRAERNKSSELIAHYKREKKDAVALIAAMKKVGDEIQELDEELRQYDEKIKATLLNIPNIPHDSVPIGEGPADNAIVRTWGEPATFAFEPRAHWDVGTKLGILDFDRAAKIAGSRFTVYFGAGAKLERGLINFMLDLHTRERGYREILPPFIANDEIGRAHV